MGSGKGKTRRALGSQPGSRITSAPVPKGLVKGTKGTETRTTTPAEVRSDWPKWYVFIRENSLGDVRLYDYYLGQIPTFPATPKECERVCKNVFADFVAVGALILPTPYAADDFEFHMGADSSLHINIRGNETTTQLLNIDYFLSAGKTMGDYDISYAIGRMTKAIRYILNS